MSKQTNISPDYEQAMKRAKRAHHRYNIEQIKGKNRPRYMLVVQPPDDNGLSCVVAYKMEWFRGERKIRWAWHTQLEPLAKAQRQLHIEIKRHRGWNDEIVESF